MRSVNFFQGQTTQQNDIIGVKGADKKPTRKGGQFLRDKAMGKFRGDQAVEADDVSNVSHNSGFKGAAKRSVSPLWSVHQRLPIKPSAHTNVSILFDSGMGADAPHKLRASASMPKLNLNGAQRQFNQERDRSHHQGSMMGILNHEEQG